jgi:glycosyltransferase involved in cell wall biosynthesis
MIKPPPELGIGTGKSVKVSVCVISFNHSTYIGDCLESIIRQKTDFDFEIVIRDDCSKDDTADVINKYADRYPDIIRIIPAHENLGANKNLLETFSHSRGIYIAICEGDDYWIDIQKLQKQVTIMDQFLECSFTAHPCRIHDETGLRETSFFKSNDLLKFDRQDVLMVSGQYAPTASYMFRKDALKNLPVWFGDAPVGDFFLEVYGMRSGYGLYLPHTMSAYRTFSLNSWSTRNNEKQSTNMISFSEKMAQCLNSMQAEPAFSRLNFSKKKAAVKFNLAVAFLMAGRYPEFSEAISNSISDFYGLSTTQHWLYKLRRLPRMAGILYRAKRYADLGFVWIRLKP